MKKVNNSQTTKVQSWCCLAFAWFFANFSQASLIKMLLIKKRLFYHQLLCCGTLTGPTVGKDSIKVFQRIRLCLKLRKFSNLGWVGCFVLRFSTQRRYIFIEFQTIFFITYSPKRFVPYMSPSIVNDIKILAS